MIVRVSLPIPVFKTFSYSVPHKWEPFIKPYIRVTVPFHNRVLNGYIVGIDNENDESLKEIKDLTDMFPLFNDSLISLSLWASRYYIAPLGLVLKFAVPQNLHVEQYLAIRSINNCTSLFDGIPLKKVLKSAGKDTVLSLYHNRKIDLCDVFTGKIFKLSGQASQQACRHKKTLFLGGMTDRVDYYIERISHSIENKEKVLMLLPDYHAAGRYFHKLLSVKFKDKVYWYGSPGKAKARMEAYFKAQNDDGCIILGNKSAAFMPLIDNGLIIVERSEEDEYRNEEGVRFNTWTIALKRAEIENSPILFGSVSPPLDIYKGVEENNVNIIDKSLSIKQKNRNIVKKRNLSIPGKLPDELIKIVDVAMTNSENVAIFTPRKDYVSQLYCLDCKKPFLCDYCGGNLGYQKRDNLLICPSCGKNSVYEEKCPLCAGNIIRFSQTGAEYIEEKLRAAFPLYRIIKVTGETVEQVVKGEALGESLPGQNHSGTGKTLKPLKPDEPDESLRPFSPTIFVGTQALSKLYLFKAKHLVLYGWEELIGISGFRASERMHNILMNLADALKPGNITFFMDEKRAVEPERFIDQTLFYPDELKKRRLAEYPPYTRLFLVSAERNDLETINRLIKKVQALSEKKSFERYIAGSLTQKKGNRYQYRIILKIPDNETVLTDLSALYSLSGLSIEPDPHSI